MSKDILEDIYFKTIIPAVLNVTIVWGHCSMKTMNEIEKVHKTAATVIHKIDKSIPKEEVLTKAGWSSISYMCKERMILLMEKVYTGAVSEKIASLFEREENRYNIRNKKRFTVPRMRTKKGQRSVSYRGLQIWKALGNEINELNAVQLRKKIPTIREKIENTILDSATHNFKAKMVDFLYT